MADASTQAANTTEQNGQAETKEAGSGKEGKAAAGASPGRRILPAVKPAHSSGFFSTLLGLILLVPIKALTLFGLYHPKKRELVLSGQPLIDNSSLKPLSDEAPEKRKLGEGEESTEDDTEEEDMQGVDEDPYKYLRDEAEYDSQEDEDYKPADPKPEDEDSAASDEFQEGDTDEDDINVDPKDIIEGKTRAKKGKGGEILPTAAKGEEKTGPIQLETQAVSEEKTK